MTAIYKYPLGVTAESVRLPAGARALAVQAQNGEVCLWALVDTEGGHLVAFGGTVQLHNGLFVLHVFLGPEQ